MYHGIINIYKEAGFTSHDVVAKMRGILRQKKIGHTGTLDPDAVGVLPVCLGSGTKLCDMLTDKDKQYEAVMLLGVETDTQDTSGQIKCQKEVTASEEEVREAVLSFVGDYMQIPPMYSALKVDGKKLYELARAGKEVERQARPVVIHEIQILEVELPRVRMLVSCSKGTYIRTLCHDIGRKLGCGAAMEKLTRTKVSSFYIEDAITLSQLQQLKEEDKVSEKVVPVDKVFEHLPAFHVKNKYLAMVKNGNALYPNQLVEGKEVGVGVEARIYDMQEHFYGVYAFDEANNRMKPVKMFLTNED